MKRIVFAAAFLAACCLPARSETVYSSIPSPVPGNVGSLGYQATQTAEFGNAVQLAGTGRQLDSVTVLMSDWAKNSTYPAMSASGWTHPLAVNLYNYGAGGSVGSLIATKTITASIPWRPEANLTNCPGDDAWFSSGTCFHGIAFTVKFDFSDQHITLPDTLIFGLAFNTNTWGYNPIGSHGPYESLNFGAAGVTTVGSDLDPNDEYWAHGAAPAGTYGRISGSDPAQFSIDASTPEPATFAMLGGALFALALLRRRIR